MSRFSDVCDAIITDLQGAVGGLGAGTVTVHRYATWDPQALTADGARHLAVWPVGPAQNAAPLTLGSHQLDQLFRILVWEDAQIENERSVADEVTAAAFFTLHDQVEARFELWANQAMASAFRVRYQATDLPERPSSVRWFEMQIAVAFAIAFQ